MAFDVVDVALVALMALVALVDPVFGGDATYASPNRSNKYVVASFTNGADNRLQSVRIYVICPPS